MPAPHLFSWLRRGDEQASCRTALSRQPSLEDAVSEVVDQLNAKGFGAAARGEADLALVFSSTSYASDLPRLLPLLRSRLSRSGRRSRDPNSTSRWRSSRRSTGRTGRICQVLAVGAHVLQIMQSPVEMNHRPIMPFKLTIEPFQSGDRVAAVNRLPTIG